MDITAYIENIEKKLKNNFDLTRNYDINGCFYDLFAEFHVRNERYFLVKKAVIYGVENNEYVLLKYFENINKDFCHDYTENLIKSIKDIVKPTNEHMCSIVTGVIVTDSISNEDSEYYKEFIKKFKYNKTFAFGYKGWVDLRLLLVSLKDGLISANKKGKEVASIYNF